MGAALLGAALTAFPALAGRRSGRPGRGIVSPLQFLLPSGPGGQDRP
jgi:hypothetical protein